ncbi:MAG TPA: UDP-glucose/GDP-mannose dehydrogenase family protein [Acidimicrobiales bacterium]|jgi:UDPglucose 6-dehydrogenase
MPKAGVRRVAVIGAGYVGLPTAAVLSHHGHIVVIAERDDRRLDALRQGTSPIVEHGLEEMLKEGFSTGRLRAVRSAAEAVVGAEFVFLCVETPQSADGSADLSYITAAAAEIAPHLADDAIIVNKSTVPVGTVGLVERVVGRPDVIVVSNPEFLREGTAVADSLSPDRVVVGADDREAAARVAELFSDSGAPIVITDATTSELIKYASNAFLATKLTFINTMAGLCEAVGADVLDLVLGIGYDKRIGFEFLRPGPGWGGSCLPKDTTALVAIAKSAGYDVSIVRGAITGNEDQMRRVVDKVSVAAGGTLEGRTIGVLGLSFKANTGDRRDSPAVSITRMLAEKGATIRAFDPTVNSTDVDLADLAHLEVFDGPYEAVSGAHAVALLTEWQEFRWLDFAKVRQLVASPAIVDARNLLDSGPLHRLGFSYSGIGRS